MAKKYRYNTLKIHSDSALNPPLLDEKILTAKFITFTRWPNKFPPSMWQFWYLVGQLLLTMVESAMILVKHSWVRPHDSSSVWHSTMKKSFTRSYMSPSSV